MKLALIYASAMASFTVEEFGTEKLQTVNKLKLKERIKGIENLTKFNSQINLNEI